MTAVHDEIKPEVGRLPYLAHGVLFVPDDWKEFLAGELHRARVDENYFGEVHFRELRGRPSKPFLVAQRWIESYFKRLIRGCPFKAFIVEQQGNQSFPFPGDAKYPDHLLVSTKAVFKAGVAWSLYRESKVRLRIVFDESDNELDRSIASKLPDVLQTEVNTRRAGGAKRYPWLRVEPVRFVSSDPREVDYDDWPFADFVQLCDILLGASFQALEVVPAPDKLGRRKLAKSIMGVMAETLNVPWLQQVPVHRKFSVSLYPDRYNMAYPAALRMARTREKCAQMEWKGIA